jgi:hypothetical protein
MARTENINVIIGEIDEAVAVRVVRKITLDVTANLIQTTPVDTGWARANWVPRLGGPSTGTAPNPGEGSGVSAASAQQSAGQAAVAARYNSLNNGRVYVSNNVPYIGRLNEGHSAQAPAGFVQAAVKKAVTQDLGRISKP